MVLSVLQIEKLLDLPLLEGWGGGSSRKKSRKLFPFSRWSNILEGQRLTPGPTVSKRWVWVSTPSV